MFPQTYDEINTILSKTTRPKKLCELALRYDSLVISQDEDNPFQYNTIALALMGEMQCYEKAGNKEKAIKYGMKAAQKFTQAAKFNFKISGSSNATLKDSWEDPLCNAIQCYNDVTEMLISENKNYLSVSTLIKLGELESRFGWHHPAGNSFEEAVLICLDKKNFSNLQRIMKEALFKAIYSYAMCPDRLDLACNLIDNKDIREQEDDEIKILCSLIHQAVAQIAKEKEKKKDQKEDNEIDLNNLSGLNQSQQERVIQIWNAICSGDKNQIDSCVCQMKFSEDFTKVLLQCIDRYLIDVKN
ncbi:hypothetical protein GPJ56_005519 [Histomonas meleagridis]|uniref:uncharacterized protein n=1 Tax=Histomonas meleagridis TaxID=135588 RepID=UPI0035599DEF|nr:hypothetical protein GPJ56_005519 [Histomonas meleagridis]KAH0799571.1 hypothetical protein GO595_007639 [Histomonas meleagridis]